MAVRPDGWREIEPLKHVAEWCSCFDFLQVNEDEAGAMASEPMALAATALGSGVSVLMVTLAGRGVVYFAAPGFERLADLSKEAPLGATTGPVRTELIPQQSAVTGGDPTGCGDVWGATNFSRLLAGDNLVDALRAAHRAAARNVEHRGATGLARHLRGELITR
jgi:sugar/nucleoside kinase (ribokinase family)